MEREKIEQRGVKKRGLNNKIVRQLPKEGEEGTKRRDKERRNKQKE